MAHLVRGDDARSVARAGALSLAGASFSALMGFVLTFAIARTLGETGAGVVLQVMAIFMIAMSIARLGMDTAAVWYLPRLTDNDQDQIAGVVAVVVLTALAAAVVTTGVILLVGPIIAGQDEVVRALRATTVLIPIASAYLVVLACSRALNGIRAYIIIGSLVVPVARPVLVVVAVLATGSTTIASVAWATPFALGLVLALAVVVRQIRRHEHSGERRGRLRPVRGVTRKLLAFGGSRVLSTAMEQGLVWLDVVLVGSIAGTAAAGIYGSTSRFLSAALLIDTAIRAVVSPMFSRLLWGRHLSRLKVLFTQATTWLVLFSMPINVLLFAFAPLVLGWLGPSFPEGSTAMRILASGMAVILGAGNVHSLLLMSGRSGWSAANKAVVLALNIAGNILLIPVGGIEAAAAVWSACMLIDATLATIEIRHFVGVTPDVRGVTRAYAIGLFPFAITSALSIWLIGQTVLALVVAGTAGLLVYSLLLYLARRTLHLAGLRTLRNAGEEITREG